MKRILTGLKPSGELTLGSYIGSISQMVRMQEEYDSFLFVADLHALTVYQDPKELKDRIKRMVALYMACGIDPQKNTIYVQSENLYHTNLAWILECNTYMGEASRMTQFKDKSSKGENVSVGLFTYPILMAADIILYDTDYVPVGVDQKQHVELARDIAERFNKRYGDTFRIPEPIIPEAGAKIMDLQNPMKKMSKSEESYKGVILLLDDPEVAKKKIMSAVTDSLAKVHYDVENQPGISNLITIYHCLTNKSIEEIELEFADANYGTFKKAVAEVVGAFLTQIQTKYQNILDEKIVDRALDAGREKTIKIAKEKVDAVFQKVGLGR